MKIRLKYFGMVASAVDKENEFIETKDGTSVQELNMRLISKYPELSNLTYQFARNNAIASLNEMLNDDDEIALLPPFAGG